MFMDTWATFRSSSSRPMALQYLNPPEEPRMALAMDLANYEGTPLYYAYEMIRALADRWGVRIIGTELVGLTPAKALIDCAEYYLKLENFDCHKQVMEYHLVGME